MAADPQREGHSGSLDRRPGPHRRIQIPGVPAGGSRPTDAGSRAPPATLSPSDKGKGAASSSSALGGSGRLEGERRHRLRCADGSFVTDPPPDSELPQKRQRTVGGVEEAGSLARWSSTSTTISLAAVAATIIWLATAAGAAASTTATTAGATDVSHPVLEGKPNANHVRARISYSRTQQLHNMDIITQCSK
jgi:hypothetical protein